MKKLKLDIVGLSYSQTQSGAYALVLGEAKGKRRLPIIIGGFEAQAIAIELEKMTPSRPLTHDLFKSFADAFEIKVKEVIIYNLVEGIFFAKLICDNGEKDAEIDTRTSDAIAIAVRFQCPIYTYEFILSSAGIILDDENAPINQSSIEEPTLAEKKEEETDIRKKPTEELKELLKKALDEEKYERASQLRDELNTEKNHSKPLIMNYDLIVIGSGPGGYVAAIRASQLGLKTAIVEKENLGGICLNWGCIPTKALLKSAQVFDYLKHASNYGINVNEAKADFSAVIKRSRDVADGMSKGVQFLLKKNKIDVIVGFGKIKTSKKVEVKAPDGTTTLHEAKNIIMALGARSRQMPNLKQDGKKVIGYREAMSLSTQPKSMVVVGSGAIGVEFAYFYSTLGTKVTIVEFLPNIVPVEDEEVSKQLERSFKKAGVTIMTDSSVESVDTKGEGCKVTVKTKKGVETIECDIVLSAVGIQANLEGIGLEEVGIITDKGKIVTNSFYQTNMPGYYAIGDCVGGQALAHVASAEGIICVEKIAGQNPEPLDYNNIPGCTYCSPEVASVGFTEKAAKEKGYDIKIGKFPFSASGKAKASGTPEGFVKLIFDAKYGELLGAHMIGNNVTEMIAEIVAIRKLETTGHDIIKTVHPHPTMSEAIMEAAAAAYGEVIHL